MEHYDLRVIEDCLVFSYEVECPNYPKEPEQTCEPKKKAISACERKKTKRVSGIKKFFLHLLVIVLAPFALLADAVFETGRFCARALAVAFRGRTKYIPVLSAFSCFVLLTAILNFL